ncbi:hypothetical protein [Roseomonas elaeocarpi]|uniref:Uncharacterized protein n=1 Tax=Roseomonas elaeocarpi TaxID=907779 RepID=A0ABV6JP34_9PROT
MTGNLDAGMATSCTALVITGNALEALEPAMLEGVGHLFEQRPDIRNLSIDLGGGVVLRIARDDSVTGVSDALGASLVA